MGFDKASGILIIIACLMAVFFLIIRKKVVGDIVDGNESKATAYLSYFVCYVMFTLVTWGFVMAIIFGIRLIVG